MRMSQLSLQLSSKTKELEKVHEENQHVRASEAAAGKEVSELRWGGEVGCVGTGTREGTGTGHVCVVRVWLWCARLCVV